MNANAMRLGIGKTWSSRWYTDDPVLYRKQLLQDEAMRIYLRKKLNFAGLESVEILRSSNTVQVNVYVARPGVAIGRGGGGIDDIRSYLSRKYQTPVDIKINEVKKPETSARVIARNIADGMERGRAPKRLMVTEKEKAITAGAHGIKIWISGTFGVPKQSRTIKLEEGVVPLQTLRANVEFASEMAPVRNAGIHGIKVWVYRKSEDEVSK